MAIVRIFLYAYMVGAMLVASPVFAHGVGASIEQTVGEYFIDIGYSPEVIVAGEQVRFDFLLYEDDTKEEIQFTDLWVRIEKDGRLQFAGGLGRAEFGTTGMTYVFPEAGTYTGFVRYSDEEGSLVEAAFEIAVAKGDGAAIGWRVVIGFCAGLLLGGIGAGALWYTVRRKALPVISNDVPPQGERGRVRIIVSILIGLVCAAGAYYATVRVLSGSTYAPPERATQPAVTEGPADIVLTAQGFEPSEITIKQGTTVTFSTTADRPFWPASNLHPSHEIYAAFDPEEPIPADETWSFTFDRVGSWNMHDHIRSYFTGTINVVP